MKLKEKRLQAGLSQSQLAKLSGVSVRTIQSCEQGIRNITSYVILKQLASTLKCEIEDLI
jgi:transcriptional regulator with XRE-family HTH domain